MEGNNITKLKANTFENFTMLRFLFLGHNQISEIEVYAFNSLQDLSYINLRNNNISFIHIDMFEHACVCACVPVRFIFKFEVIMCVSAEAWWYLRCQLKPCLKCLTTIVSCLCQNTHITNTRELSRLWKPYRAFPTATISEAAVVEFIPLFW